MATLTLQPDSTAGIDTYTSELSANTNFATSGSLGIRGISGGKEYTLIKFDLSSLAGATITSATLSLFGSGSGASITADIYRILSANSGWTESGATWNYAVATSTRWAGDTGNNGGSDAGCSVSGTDHSSTIMGTIVYVSTAGVEATAALDATEFANMVSANYGIVLKGRGTGATEAQPCSSDHATAARRPKLVVEYIASGHPAMARWRGVSHMKLGNRAGW